MCHSGVDLVPSARLAWTLGFGLPDTGIFRVAVSTDVRPTDVPGAMCGAIHQSAYATPERFAMDVSDYIKFAEVVRNCPVRPHVHNSLPNDRVHFSPSGN
jgi:hypothetical protein